MACSLRSGLTNRSHSSNAQRRHTLRRPSALPASSSSAGPQFVDSLQQQLQQIQLQQTIQLPDSDQGLHAVQQYSGQAAAAAAAAWSNIISPFAIFGDSWLLNILFLGSMGLLAYSLLILAPRQ